MSISCVLATMSEGIRATREVAGYSADRIRIGSLYSLTNRTVPALVMALNRKQSRNFIFVPLEFL